MSRVKRGVEKRKSHKKVLKQTKGFRGRASKCYKIADIRLQKAMEYAYIGRKLKKRDYRSLWIVRLNAACRELGLKYSQFIDGLAKAGIEMNRKTLSNLAISHPEAFEKVVNQAKQALA
jgi:large subunit ribosomal protein L20